VKISVSELGEATAVEGFEELGELGAPPVEEPETIEHLDAAMEGLECTFEGCTSGEAGAKFKTPAGDLAHTILYLQQHREDVHGQREAGAGGGASKVQLSKIPRPEISGGCSQEDFKFFTRKWAQYVRSSNEKDQTKLKDHS
jgi:hypothetical protein